MTVADWHTSGVQVSGEFIFQQDNHDNALAYTVRALFSEINISQGSVVTDLRCGEIFNDLLIPNSVLSLKVKEF